MLPIGFKNGFCVMDLECSDGGTFTYGCSNMGISAHCGDIYGAGLSCQWIDVTGIPTGSTTPWCGSTGTTIPTPSAATRTTMRTTGRGLHRHGPFFR